MAIFRLLIKERATSRLCCRSAVASAQLMSSGKVGEVHNVINRKNSNYLKGFV